MKKLADCSGREVRLTDERLAHILEHPEMKEMTGAFERVIGRPQILRRSSTDASARLFYEFHSETVVGGKWLCVVVKQGGK